MVSILSTLYYFIHSVSSKFYSKPWSLIIPHKNFLKCRILLGLYSTYFKSSRLRFSNYGFNFKHSFTILYIPFVWHSIIKWLSLINPDKNFDKCRAVLGFFLHVLQTSQIRVSIISTLLLFYLCTPFLWYSIINQYAWSFPTKILKNVDCY